MRSVVSELVYVGVLQNTGVIYNTNYEGLGYNGVFSYLEAGGASSLTAS